MDDVVTVPVFKGVIFNRESDKSLMMKEEPVVRLVMTLKEHSVLEVVEGSYVDCGLTSNGIAKDQQLGSTGGGSQANRGLPPRSWSVRRMVLAGAGTRGSV